jgi:hypothetical protein
MVLAAGTKSYKYSSLKILKLWEIYFFEGQFMDE